MVSLPPDVSGELFYDGVWNAASMRTTSEISVTRGLSSESSTAADPMSTDLVLDNRNHEYSPRNPESSLYGKIGRNTPFRLIMNEGGPYLDAPSGVYGLSTPDNATLDVTGNIDVRIDVTPDDWADGQMFTCRFVPGSVNWSFAMGPDGDLYLWWSDGGVKYAKSTDVPHCANGERAVLRATLDVDNGASGHTVQFWQGKDINSENEWAMIGDPVTTAGTTSLPSIDAAVHVGDDELSLLPDGSSGIGRFMGKIHAFQVLDGINGTAVIDFKTADNAEVGGSSFTDNTGLVWTLSGVITLDNTHIRSIGEVPAWPPTRDLSGNDTTVAIEPAGITRRLDAGNKPVDSALLRFLRFAQPVECWPLIDGAQSTVGQPLINSSPMVFQDSGGDSTGELPAWADGTIGDWVEPVVNFHSGSFGSVSGLLPNSSALASFYAVDIFFRVDGTSENGVLNLIVSDRGAGTDAENRNEISVAITVYPASSSGDNIRVSRTSYGDDSSSFALLSTVDPAGIADGLPHHIRIEVDPGASDTFWELYVDGTVVTNGTMSGIVFEAGRRVEFNWGAELGGGMDKNVALGYVTYWDNTGAAAHEIYEAYQGYPGELAGDRINRLCTEAGVTSSVSGPISDQVQLGIQNRDKFVALLNTCAESDLGYLLERRDENEIIYRSHTTLYNQAPVISLDFSDGVISAPFAPTDDDKLTRNDVSVQREGGGIPSRQVMETGSMSVLDPPDGVGRYDVEYTRNLYTDELASQLAYQYLHLGTYEGVRYTRITLNLANPRVYAMLSDIYRADVGDKIRLTNIPRDHGVGPVDVLIQGYSETIGPGSWKITFNCIPGEPWTTGVVESEEFGRADADNSTLSASANSSATSLMVATDADSALWVDSATYASDFPFDVLIGGEVMTVTAVTGTSSPQTFTVTRSVNGVVKSHTTGEDVRLATPTYVAL